MGLDPGPGTCSYVPMPNPEPIFGATAPTATAPTRLEGRRVSLNLPLRSFFKLPGTTFEMSKGTPSAIIPETLTLQQRKSIERAISLGELVFGDSPVTRRPQRPEALQGFLALFNDRSMPQSVIEQSVKSMVNKVDQDPSIGGYTRHEVLELAFEAEMKSAARGPILEFLTRAKEAVPGPTKPVDEPPAARSQERRPTLPVTEPDAADIGSL